jgi:hypothetical protein
MLLKRQSHTTRPRASCDENSRAITRQSLQKKISSKNKINKKESTRPLFISRVYKKNEKRKKEAVAYESPAFHLRLEERDDAAVLHQRAHLPQRFSRCSSTDAGRSLNFRLD